MLIIITINGIIVFPVNARTVNVFFYEGVCYLFVDPENDRCQKNINDEIRIIIHILSDINKIWKEKKFNFLEKLYF